MDGSFLRQCSPEAPTTTSTVAPNDNRTMRRVRSGHYVRVRPTPLSHPKLIAHSPSVAGLLGIPPSDLSFMDWTKFLSGDVGEEDESWCTPYALSIMGRRMVSNCPFGTGEGYGDGRAISIAEVNVNASPDTSDSEPDAGDRTGERSARWELQLKGAGPTPFCRGADGRAVLRSSIREFLASEAMHHLGISTTRALSLVVSGSDTSKRPWYSGDDAGGIELDDPRLRQYPLHIRQQILTQLAQQNRDPDVMVEEANAITCRVAASFLRVGHFDLLARRVENDLETTSLSNTKTGRNWKELKELTEHACFREFPEAEVGDLGEAAELLLEQSAEKLAEMVAGWIRVGFVQGNFNADNCLIAGRTMDYGPFGFMDEYSPLYSKWVGSGQHFGFLNQPNAAFVNYTVLVESIAPLFMESSTDEEEAQKKKEKKKQQLVDRAKILFAHKVEEVFVYKLGLAPLCLFPEEAKGKKEETTTVMIDPKLRDTARKLWEELEALMRKHRVDWTLFWRQLAHVVECHQEDFRDKRRKREDDEGINNNGRNTTTPIENMQTASNTAPVTTNKHLLITLIGNEEANPGTSPFYEALPPESYIHWLTWLNDWKNALIDTHGTVTGTKTTTKPVPTTTTSCSASSSSAPMSLDAVSPTATNQQLVVHQMRQSNPKYILREWMLADAYTKAAADGDYDVISGLLHLTEHPYDEGTPEQHDLYYRRTPDVSLKKGGVAFMS